MNHVCSDSARTTCVTFRCFCCLVVGKHIQIWTHMLAHQYISIFTIMAQKKHQRRYGIHSNVNQSTQHTPYQHTSVHISMQKWIYINGYTNGHILAHINAHISTEINAHIKVNAHINTQKLHTPIHIPIT